jgi:hypothetical protein
MLLVMNVQGFNPADTVQTTGTLTYEALGPRSREALRSLKLGDVERGGVKRRGPLEAGGLFGAFTLIEKEK